MNFQNVSRMDCHASLDSASFFRTLWIDGTMSAFLCILGA